MLFILFLGILISKWAYYHHLIQGFWFSLLLASDWSFPLLHPLPPSLLNTSISPFRYWGGCTGPQETSRCQLPQCQYRLYGSSHSKCTAPHKEMRLEKTDHYAVTYFPSSSLTPSSTVFETKVTEEIDTKWLHVVTSRSHTSRYSPEHYGDQTAWRSSLSSFIPTTLLYCTVPHCSVLYIVLYMVLFLKRHETLDSVKSSHLTHLSQVRYFWNDCICFLKCLGTTHTSPLRLGYGQIMRLR